MQTDTFSLLRFSLWALLLAILSLSSCASAKFQGTAAMTGRVCGKDGRAVEHYHVDFGGTRTATTGMNGIFLIPEMRAGTYTVSGGGKGWSSFEETVEFTDRRRIFTAQVEPISSVYAQVERLLRAENVAEAEALLLAQKKYNKGDGQFQFYEKLVSYVKSPSEQKRRAIEEFVEALAGGGK